MYEHFWKRLIDIVLSTLGIIVLAIPMLVVAIIIKIDSPGPVFFKQKRVGKNKKFFTIIKFRSMPVTVPNPALWNQDDLVAERDKYGANDIKPGLTGWAQIHGRDEIEIPLKAKYDGEYTAKLKQGGFKAFAFDIMCFFKSIFSVLKHDGVVEGGTGAIAEEKADTL